ncbi:MAG: DHH family phosphoesterase [Clostridia bacterium]|nr:DHH family phosphoesterase [Clostridia bacterium]
MYNQQMLSALKNADNFMVCCHIMPDGDAIGSLLALGRLLQRMGKSYVLVSQDGVPASMMCLPDAGQIHRPEELAAYRIDTALSVDVSEANRMGDKVLPYFEKAALTLQIDHHPTNPGFAMHNHVDAAAAAAGELVLGLWEDLGEKPDAETAYQLYCAIDSDSGNFRFSSVRPYTFYCMQQLMEAGLDISKAARELFMVKSRGHIAALGKALSSLTYFADGQATYMRLSLEDKAACGASMDDINGIVNNGLYLTGVKMCFMGDEVEGGWKYSLRALPGYDVSVIAVAFGGGGHKLASGCLVKDSFENTSARMMDMMEQALKA